MALCKHEWVDYTRLGSPQRELICSKCGDVKYEALPAPSHFMPNSRSAAGVEMHLVKEGGGNGDPYRWSVTCNHSLSDPSYIAQYGCGCTWEIDKRTLMSSRVSGPTHGIETSCPVHSVRRGIGPYDPNASFPAIGYAQGGAISGGLVSVSLSTAPRYEPPRELELTFETEPIVGWRMWRVVTHHLHGGITEPRLQPLTGRNLWEPRERYAAVCLPGAQRFVYGVHGSTTHEAPGRNCDCGTWAVRERKDLPDVRGSGDGGVLCVGEVHLWGRVLEFKKGWRAKYAYPKSLTLLSGDQAVADDLARLYGVEVALDPPQPDPHYMADAVDVLDWVKQMMGTYQPGPGPLLKRRASARSPGSAPPT